MRLSAEQLQEYRAAGFVVLDTMVPVCLLEPLRAAAARATARARAGGWAHGIRTAASPFPPYNQDATADVWAVHLLVHPDMGEPAFLDWYGSDEVRGACAQLLGVQGACPAQQLQLQLVNMLINPERVAFGLPWHRDSLAASATDAEELAALCGGDGSVGFVRAEPAGGAGAAVQWNTALYEDACLRVVPGSHRRVRTAVERATTTTALAGPGGMARLPGEAVVRLRAGQTVVYDPNLLHRADYDPAARRATLHCSMGYGEAGAANLAHVLGRGRMGWVQRGGAFEQSLAGRAPGIRALYEQLLVSLEKAERAGLLAGTDDGDVRMQAYRGVAEQREGGGGGGGCGDDDDKF
jgi:ectoine hydroxylase-related dioxygenase (phytanoyl-CoA dioxygenase family)